ncbi:MAG: hypothetical protein U1F67_25410 [Rubrivivax sp.]
MSGGGSRFDPDKLAEAQRRGLLRVVRGGFNLVRFHTAENGELRNGWRPVSNIGACGDNRLFASAVGMVGCGGNSAVETMYPPKQSALAGAYPQPAAIRADNCAATRCAIASYAGARGGGGFGSRPSEDSLDDRFPQGAAMMLDVEKLSFTSTR